MTFNAQKEDKFIVWSKPCASDPVTNRPIFGQLNVNPYVVNQNFRALMDSFLRKTLNVMGFSKQLFKYFIDENMAPISVYKTAVHDIAGNITGLRSPNVLRVAKEHFNCQYIRSVSLENDEDGRNPVQGTHWERNLMMNEIMTASGINNYRVSMFTLAVMQDSGWYTVDTSFAEHFTHWKNVGCVRNLDLEVETIIVNTGGLEHL